MPLAPSCSECAFFQPPLASRCRRHAPGTGFEKLELTHWPLVNPGDRCGSSEAISDGTETVSCGRCIHWFQPGGIGIRPGYLREMTPEWWEKSGYCTRFAPGPSSDKRRQTHWRCTHISDRCGDGEEAKIEQLETALAAT